MKWEKICVEKMSEHEQRSCRWKETSEWDGEMPAMCLGRGDSWSHKRTRESFRGTEGFLDFWLESKKMEKTHNRSIYTMG